MRYQQSWNSDETDKVQADNQANLEATIHRALDLGIHHIETARGYGTSEFQLGKVLPSLPRDEIIVQTKVAPHADPKEFAANFDQSMQNLQLDYVDLFALHGINNREVLELALRPKGCIEQAMKWKAEGRIRHLGFSTHGIMPEIVSAINSGAFDYVNLHWYFVNDLNRPAIDAATQQDMGVFIISPNDKGGKLYEPPAKLVELCQPLSPMQFNDLYTLMEERVHTLSLGAARPSDFDAHIEALTYWDRREELIPPIVKKLRAEINRCMGDGWTKNWCVGLPEYYDVPGQINVKEILRLFALAKSLDLVAFGKMRYNLLGNGGHWFPGTKAADFSDETLRPVLQHSPYAEQIPEMLRAAHDLLNDKPKKRLSEGD
jgi:predicted aldo/keto reductase-like oxidoreductase